MQTVLDTLNLALGQLDGRRQEWEKEVDEVRRQYDARRAVIERAIADIASSDGSTDGAFAKSAEEHTEMPNGHTPLSVGEDKIDAVRQYLREHGGTRQADIAKDLGFNSGTVSVALRILRKAGEAVPGDKEAGSRIWNPARVLATV